MMKSYTVFVHTPAGYSRGRGIEHCPQRQNNLPVRAKEFQGSIWTKSDTILVLFIMHIFNFKLFIFAEVKYGFLVTLFVFL